MRRRITLILIIVAVIGGLGLGVTALVRHNSGGKLLARARVSIEARQYTDALDLADRYVGQRPDDWHGHYVRAQALVYLNRFDEARASLGAARRLVPNEMAVRLAVARTYSVAARQDLAPRRELGSPLARYRQAAGEPEPGGAPAGFTASIRALREAVREVGVARLRATGPDAAATWEALWPDDRPVDVAAVTAALQHFPEPDSILEGMEMLGVDLMLLGTTHQKIAWQLSQDAAALRTAPGGAEAARTAVEEGQRADERGAAAHAEAMAVLLAVIQTDATRERAAETLLTVAVDVFEPAVPVPLEELERRRVLREQALAAATRAIEALPPERRPVGPALRLIEHRVAQAPRGDSLQVHVAALREALAAAEQLRTYQPQHPEVLYTVADLERRLGRPEEAQRLADAILAVDSRHVGGRLLKAQIQLQGGRVESARSVLHELHREISPDHLLWAEAQLTYAMASAAVGDLKLARDTMRQVTLLDPTYAEARRFLAQSLLEDRLEGNGFNDAQAYFESRPGDPRALDLYVEAAIAVGRPNAARVALERTLASADATGNPALLLAAAARGFAMLDDAAGAEQASRRILEHTEGDDRVLALVYRAEALTRLDREAEAQSLLEGAIAARADRPEPELHFALSRLYQRIGLTASAEAQLARARELDGENPAYWLASAEWALARGISSDEELAAIKQDLDAAIRRQPYNSHARVLMGQVALLEGDHETAQREMRMVGQNLQSGLPAALTFLAAGQPQRCAEICESELRARPDDPQLVRLLAQAYEQLGRAADARSRREQLVRLAPQDLGNYERLAALLPPDQTPEQVAEALGVLPGADRMLVDLVRARLLDRRGRLADAVEAYGQVLQRRNLAPSTEALVRLLRARAAATAGRPDVALRDLRRLYDSREYGTSARGIEAAMLARTGGAEAAEPILLDLVSRGGHLGDIAAFRAAAQVYVALRLPDQAVEVARQARQAMPEDPDAALLTAQTLRAIGRGDEAVEWFDRAIALRPDRTSPYVRKAQLLDELQRLPDALATLETLEQLGTEAQAAALLERSRLLLSHGLREPAVRTYDRLAELDVSDPRFRLVLGQALLAAGDADRAREQLERIGPFAPQRVEAQYLLASLEPTPEARLAALAALEERRPGLEPTLIQRLHVLRSAGRGRDAAAAFEQFVALHGPAAVSDSTALLAVWAVLEGGEQARAAVIAAERARQTGSPAWVARAAVLLAEAAPAEALSLVPDDPASAPGVLAAIGLALSVCTDGEIEPWAQRLTDLLSQPGGEAEVPALMRVLAGVAAGDAEMAREGLAAFGGMGYITPEVARQVVDAPATPAHRRHAARLLLAGWASFDGLDGAARRTAMEVFQADPACQWAAAQAVQARADLDDYRALLARLEPPDTALAHVIHARLAASEGRFAEAAEAYRQALQASPQADPSVTLDYGQTLVEGGQFDAALDVYRSLWTATRSSEAANSLAYLIVRLHADEPARLQEALDAADGALAAMRDEPATGDEALQWAAALDTRGWVHYLLGHNEQALGDLRRAVRTLPGSLEVHYHLGCAEKRAGRLEVARWHFAEAVRLGRPLRPDAGGSEGDQARVSRQAQEALAALDPSPLP